MGIEKISLLMTESEYWVNMNANIEQTVKQCHVYLEYQYTQLCKTTLQYDIPCKLWEVVGADIFMNNNNKNHCIICNLTKTLCLIQCEKLVLNIHVLNKKVLTNIGKITK